MPDATVSQETYHRELKTLEGGFVELKQLPYHDMLVRRDKGSIASMEATQQRRKKGEPETQKLTIESMQTWERQYMFKNCIVNHNLEDKEGNPLDFRNEMALHILRPDIGIEIERLIEELNGGETLDADFPSAPTSSTEQQRQEPLMLAHTDTPTNQQKK